MIIEQQTSHHPDAERAQEASRSDGQLMAAVAEGNSTALEQLYDRHVRRCFGLALRILQDPSLAEDVVQDVFIRLWSRPGTLSPACGSFQICLLTLVRNQALDTLRDLRNKSGTHILALPIEGAGAQASEAIVDMPLDTGFTSQDQALDNETAIVVRRALGQLSSPEHQAITHAYFEGLSQQEIATKLDRPLDSVKTDMRSALCNLDKLFKLENVPDKAK